ncbi:sensor histidine kinase [Leeia sp. TBRC 13508]|uniref:histidine kinase n=1 Tax=Leeia speluncae TaxID=2884804 RepID=A0ABS8D565_9NEIS|nr:ATP-binding protein [Leeia speluncae]MCB6183335.1 sensor histidine kinase [Leeia speluncae]
MSSKPDLIDFAQQVTKRSVMLFSEPDDDLNDRFRHGGIDSDMPLKSHSVFLNRATLFKIALLLFLMGCIGALTFHLSMQHGINTLQESASKQLQFHAKGIESEMGKYAFLPSILELEQPIKDILMSPSPKTREAANRYLSGLNQRAGSRVVYVLDQTGRVLATSNWDDEDSYLDEDLSFRPYWQDAIKGTPGRFYGIGITVGEPGYYLSHPLKYRDRIVGVGVAKIKLEALEERWQKAGLHAFVTDSNGIIILSSDPALKLKAINPISPAKREALARSLQYYWQALLDLAPITREPIGHHAEILVLKGDKTEGNRPVSYIAQTRQLQGTPWGFTLLVPLDSVKDDAISNAILAATLFACFSILLIAWNERRKVIRARLAAREALRKANSELEQRITERTEVLQQTNLQLMAEVESRMAAEQHLRETQDELVQASKMAAIGQMSTGIAHELNQPLAALRTIAANSIRFLERGNQEVVTTNLQMINELVDRMGRTTANLRAFARKPERKHGTSSLKRALDANWLLLQPRLEGVIVVQDNLNEDVILNIDQTSLEQILTNLIGNAIDAMQSTDTPRLIISAKIDNEKLHLTVADNGSGLSTEALNNLFQPFFTTKPAPHGLGLGLTLSASLAAAVGGKLSAEQIPTGGAAFTLTLDIHQSDES